MNKLSTLVVCLSISAALTAATPAYAGIQEDAILKTVSTYLPGTTGIGKLKVNKVLVNQKKKTITISLSKEGAYIPFTKDSYEAFKNDCRSALGSRYAKYKVIVKAGDKSLENMYLFSQKKNIAPKEKTPFVQRLEAAPAPLGLRQQHCYVAKPRLVFRAEAQQMGMAARPSDADRRGPVHPKLCDAFPYADARECRRLCDESA